MNKYKCLIIDDEPLAIEAIEILLDDYNDFHIVAKCRNAFEALEILSKSKIDLVFLDINMPKITGLDFLKITNRNFKVILTTAYRDYALESYDFEVLDYLLKPIRTDRFGKAIKKFKESIKAKELNYNTDKNIPQKYVFIRQDRKDIKVNFDDIHYIEGMKDYIIIYTKEQKIITKKTLSSFINELPQKLFARVHKSYIVSVNAIDSISSEEIRIGEKSIPYSKSYKDAIQEIISSK